MKGLLNIPNMGEKIRNVCFIGMDMMILNFKWGSCMLIFLPFRGGGVGACPCDFDDDPVLVTMLRGR